MRRLRWTSRLGAVAVAAGLSLSTTPAYAGPPEEGAEADPPAADGAEAPPEEGTEAGEGEAAADDPPTEGGEQPPEGEAEAGGAEAPAEPAPEPAEEPAEETAPEESSAEDTDMSDVRAAFAKAAKYYELGEYGEAIVIFENLFEQTANIALLFNLGQSYWKRFNVDPNVAYLRKAKQMFENYNTRSAADDPEYNSREVDRYIAAIDAQMLGVEAADRASLQPVGPTKADREFDQRTVVNKTLIITGTVAIVLGSAATLLGLAGGLTRAGTSFSLDQNGGRGNGSPNLLSPSENEQLRSAYLLGGQLAFAGLISGGVLLPVGITLSVVGNQRQKKQIQELAVAPGSLIQVRF